MADPVCFIDTETTALDRDVRQIWEVALIDSSGTEWEWHLPVDLSRADPMSLGMNGFHDRWGAKPMTDLTTFAGIFARLTRGQHLVGACVHFDEHTLWDLLRDNGECPMWHYHIIDCEALAAGFLRGLHKGGRPKLMLKGDPAEHADQIALPPWKSNDLSLAVGVDPDKFDRHSAIGDARWAKAVYEAVMG